MRELLLLLSLCAMATATENCEHISDDQVMNLYQLIGPGKWSRFTYDESGCQQMRRNQLSGQELVDYVTSNQNLWTAKLNPNFNDLEEIVKWGLLGVNHVRNSVKARKTLGISRHLDIDLPINFDARQQWPKCQSIKMIHDKSICGSCWAFGAVEAMSDRICVTSGGLIQVSLSADDLLSCCHSCGSGDGGDPFAAWQYWVEEGIVSGSNFTKQEGCKPFTFLPCKYNLNSTAKCVNKCQAGYSRAYDEDKYYGLKAYAVDNNVQAIQNELYKNGPLEISFEVYEDFLNYQGGIYFHKAGKLVGGHAAKLIGWSEENEVPYWTVANSWSTDWGEGGFFRIIRGQDECGIESGVVGGLPDIQRTIEGHRLGHDPKKPLVTTTYDYNMQF